MNVSEFLQFIFKTSNNKTKTVRIPNPDNGLPNDTLLNAAGKMVIGNVFAIDGGGTLTGISKIQLHKVSRSKVTF